MVIADNCALYVNMIFGGSSRYSGSAHLLGAVFFAFQIYSDFSGYSDIAIGTARLFGFDLLRNFAFPYFSRDIAEFWRRWHISLSSWFRDYLYIPLGGSKGGNWKKIRNVLIIFLVSGFWHGANWTFLVWGLLNAIYIMPSVLLNTNRKNLDIVAKGKIFPTIREAVSMVVTFSLTVFAWIFFRATSIRMAFRYIRALFSRSLFSVPPPQERPPTNILVLLLVFIFIEWIGREQQYALESISAKWPKAIRWTFYMLIIAVIVIWYGTSTKFIYFQF